MSDTGFSIEDGKTLLSEAFAPWVLAQNLMPKSFSKTTATFVLPANDDLALRGGPGAGLICGQAIAAAADTATVIALAGANGRFRNCTTVDLSVNYLRPLPMGDTNITVELKAMAASSPPAALPFSPKVARNLPPSPRQHLCI